MKPTFSIIMPVYNSEQFLDNSIASVLKQSVISFELIIVNDGSTDNSKNIIEKYQKKDNRIKVFNQTKIGVSSVRNKGLKEAKGEYICFLDSDDEYDKEYLNNFFNVLNNKDYDLITSGFNIKINTTLIPNFYLEKIYLSKKSIYNDLINLYTNHILYNIWNNCYKKQIIAKNNILFDENLSFGEDIKFNQTYLLNINNMYNSKLCLYNYNKKNKESLTNTFKDNIFLIRKQENKEFIDYFKRIGLIDYDAFIAKRFIDRVFGIIVDSFRPEYKFSIKKRIIFIKKIINDTDTTKYSYVYVSKSPKMNRINKYIKNKNILKIYIITKIISLIKVILPTVFYKQKQKR